MTGKAPGIVETGADPLLAGGRMTVDLDALAANWRLLAERSGKAETAAMLKADAYGLGADHVADALAVAGCATFFVATVEEGIRLRRAVPGCDIFVIGGVSDMHAAAACAESRLVPVLNTMDEIANWAGYWRKRGSRRPCAIHVDTGMNRLGLPVDEALAFAVENDRSHAVTPILLMSHLACADETEHAMNRRQLESFQRLCAVFQGIDSSLSNSAGIFLGPDYHFDLTRPGISIYGGAAQIGRDNPMRPVVTVEARIAQIRHAKAGETVSYGATVTLQRNTRIAVVAAGYADGYHRAGSGHGVALREARTAGGHGIIGGHKVPVLGRVTMDLTMFDVTDMPEDDVRVGDWMELLGANIGVDEVAAAAGTVSYEVLTSLGNRYYRRYVGGGTTS